MEKYVFASIICALLIFSNYTVVIGVNAAREELYDARQIIEYLKPVSTDTSLDIFAVNESIGRALNYLDAAKSRDDIPMGFALLLAIGFGIQEWRHYRLKKAYEHQIKKKS
ncbi:hypothetical protein [Hyphococcus sp.]|uniref:hypothetical protein n=1 Tax=Hyphococcus sp. TaxID=2038636 RepID=UPI003CCBC716